MFKHRRLDHNIYNILTRISSLERVCLVRKKRKKPAIFKQVKKRHAQSLQAFSLHVISDFY